MTQHQMGIRLHNHEVTPVGDRQICGNRDQQERQAPGRRAIAWPYACGIIGYHLLALLALVPWFFTWSGVVESVAGLFVFGTLGINLGYIVCSPIEG